MGVLKQYYTHCTKLPIGRFIGVDLSRYGIIPGSGISQIDTLKYTYSGTNANQLLKVTDGTDAAHTGNGFRNITGSSTNYTYDGNGNLSADAFKGITKITYDVLNRTDSIKISSSQYITYTYDADGALLRKKAYLSGAVQTTTDYIDGFVYITVTTGTAALSYFPMPEGRVLDSAGNFTQEFIMTDQQGNARVAFRNVGGIAKVFQENSYYGTGLILPNSPVSTPTVANKKLYNGGSEWQNDSPVGSTNPYNLPDYYETANRNYDATIGRFIGVDPMAESAESMTGYQYGGCNPIIANDPDGALLNINRQNSVPPMAEGPTPNEFDYENLEVGGGTNVGSSYGDATGATGSNGIGLYYSDPGAYWNAYYESGGTFGGPSIYHASSGPGDPATGMSLAQMSLTVYGRTTTADVLAPYRGQEVWFSGDGRLISAHQLAPGDWYAIIANQLGVSSMSRGISEDQLIDLILSQPAKTADNGDDGNDGTSYSVTVDWGTGATTIAHYTAEGVKISDVALTATGVVKIGGELRNINWAGEGTFDMVTDITGTASIVINGADAYNQFSNGNWKMGAWDTLKAGATLGFLIFGGEEATLAFRGAELLWNVGTTVIDESNGNQ
jgi:RHS repeat-associated protein